MKHLFSTLLILAFATLNAQQPTHTLYLVGDAGKTDTPGPVLQLLDEQLKIDANGSVIFLGDNIYPDGLHLSNKPGDTTQSERNLLCQLKVVSDYAGNVFFVPGNHDWNAGKPGGLKAINAEKKYINDYLYAQSNALNRTVGGYLPTAGLPGPQSYLLSPGIRMIALDTQWFLHFHKKDNAPGKTRKQTAEAFYNGLDSLLSYCQTRNEKALLVYHHPLFTNGGHGAPKQPLRFLINYTPFQLLGLIGGNRWLVQDIPQPRFKKMRNRMLAIMGKYKGVINISGHEHYMQHFSNGDDHFIVSGSGSKLSHKKVNIYTEDFYTDQQPGFAKLLIYPDGSAKVEYWGATDKKVLKTIDLGK